MAAWTVTALALGFIGVLFFIANWGECDEGKKFINRNGGIVYSLSLAVFVTSWTYYGAVGTAVTLGWDYMTMYLGPILLYLFGQPFLAKLLHVANKNNVTSIADFIAARYGKRRNIALSVAMLCLFVVVPYIALQLKAVTSSYHIMLGLDLNLVDTPWYGDAALPTAVAMAFFASLFGARNPHLTEQNRGVILAVAFESLIKICVLVLLAGIVYFFVLESKQTVLQDFVAHANESLQRNDGSSWITLTTKTLLVMAAIFLLPRQFHVTFVASVSSSYLRVARKWFTSYLIVVTVVVIPISVAGMMMFPDNLRAADEFVLLIPAASGWDILTFLVFIGGFSAATSMIVIASLALSTMISNDVIMPIILRVKRNRSETADYSQLLLPIRRTTIALVMLLSWLYYVIFAREYDLAETGLLTLALIVQLAPATVGGLYWRKGNAWGVYAGLAAGSLLWFYTLMLPQLVSLGLTDTTIMQSGLLGYSWLHPQSLFNAQLDSLSHGVLFSLSANVISYVLVSQITRVPLQDRLQAKAFVEPNMPSAHQAGHHRHANIRSLDLSTLLERFIGTQRARKSLIEFSRQRLNLDENSTAVSFDLSTAPDPGFIKHVERELAGVIGASSAATMVNAVLEGRSLDVEDVVTLFGNTSQAIRFSRKILFSTLEHLSEGISVVDRSLNLVAWNRAYLKMFDYPVGLIRVGAPIADIIRFNSKRGLIGPGDVEEHVAKRVSHLKKGQPYVFQRKHSDGRTIEIRGNPIPGGGFVTTYIDMTEHNNIVKALAEAKLNLEERVQDRTKTIRLINSELVAEVERRKQTERQLLRAKAEAESANASKSRFLALASHDVLQPLNAARLFTSALAGYRYRKNDPRAQIISQLENSLGATEQLISTLLEIAQFDDGKLKPNVQAIELCSLLTPLLDEHSLLASQKGLGFKENIECELWVSSDATYLRRILQNVLSNAVKYTDSGRVLLTCRPRSDMVLIQIWDTGTGIPGEELDRIFDDFYRIEATASNHSGIGLGLAVVQRLARLLGVQVQVRSTPGKGTVFSLLVPVIEPPLDEIAPIKQGQVQKPISLNVVCVDDDLASLEALDTLLRQWHIGQVMGFIDADQLLAFAENNEAPDVVIIDYQLSHKQDGITVFKDILRYWPDVTGILVSASSEIRLPQMAEKQGMIFLSKPLKPAALRACLAQIAHI